MQNRKWKLLHDFKVGKFIKIHIILHNKKMCNTKFIKNKIICTHTYTHTERARERERVRERIYYIYNINKYNFKCQNKHIF